MAPIDEQPAAESVEEVDAPVVETAEDIKKRGNEAFVSKQYDEAIVLYNQAIALDGGNAVLFSNRSACFAAKKLWQKALEDAATSISKDAGFIKAYYRLASAQTELGLYDDAILTLKAALTKEPNNEQIVKQLKQVQTKKAGGVVEKPKKKMSDAQKKEAMELQEQTQVYVRDLKSVQARMNSNERETRTLQVTMNHLGTLDKEVPVYRAVGKAFLLTARDDLEKRLETSQEQITRSQRDLTDRQQYLERRITSNTTNLKDLMNEYAP